MKSRATSPPSTDQNSLPSPMGLRSSHHGTFNCPLSPCSEAAGPIMTNEYGKLTAESTFFEAGALRHRQSDEPQKILLRSWNSDRRRAFGKRWLSERRYNGGLAGSRTLVPAWQCGHFPGDLPPIAPPV